MDRLDVILCFHCIGRAHRHPFLMMENDDAKRIWRMCIQNASDAQCIVHSSRVYIYVIICRMPGCMLSASADGKKKKLYQIKTRRASM